MKERECVYVCVIVIEIGTTINAIPINDHSIILLLYVGIEIMKDKNNGEEIRLKIAIPKTSCSNLVQALSEWKRKMTAFKIFVSVL